MATTEKKVEFLTVDSAWIKKAGLNISLTHDAAEQARANLKAMGAEYTDSSTDADKCLILMDEAQAAVDRADTSLKDAAVILATIDKGQLYRNVRNPMGKPYTSTLALAKDMWPRKAESTVAQILGNGRDVYLPALEGKFGKAGPMLLNQSPGVAAVLKASLKDDSKRKEILKAMVDKSKGGKLTANSAREIVRGLKNASADEKSTGVNTTPDAKAKVTVAEKEWLDTMRKSMLSVKCGEMDRDADTLTVYVTNAAATRTMLVKAIEAGGDVATATLKALVKSMYTNK